MKPEQLQKIFSVLDFFGLNSILGILTFAGFCYFLVKRFVRRKAPVPSSAFETVPRELFQKCVTLLKKQEKRTYEAYTVPEEILSGLRENMQDEVYLKKLLCSICAHLGIDGSFIKLIVQDSMAEDRAGEITTDLAFTTIRLEMKPHYTLDAVIAVLAHEAIHLHLYYTGIQLKDTWENEILTDTAAVYCGFGEYIYKGYAVMRGEFAFSYRKVGYIRQEDVQYIQRLIGEE